MIEIKTQNFKESFDFEKVANQASGAVWYQNGETILAAAVSVNEDERVEGDFVPLVVQYVEKTYANAKFPSGFIKRESKPSDFETLTSRIVDRTLRPLFPSHYRHPTQISILVLSYDGKSDLQVCALNAASSALFVSSVPIAIPVNALRIGKSGDRFLIQPSPEELENSELDLYVSGYEDHLLMIEMKSNQVGEKTELTQEELSRAIEIAKEQIALTSKEYSHHFRSFIKDSFEIIQDPQESTKAIEELIWKHYHQDLQDALLQMSKSERQIELKKLANQISKHPDFVGDEDLLMRGLLQCKREALREMILQKRVRADGRGLKEVRPISIQTNLLPCTHGSCLFKRGQTQVLVVSTIGGDNDAQSYELLGDRTASKERFMVHYNFPGFSVGEASMIGAPGRRELGHGNLAKRALESSLQDRRVVRLVSEVLESNGSSSMASVCGGSMALQASGVQTKHLIAGVAMGLIKEGEQYAILTDIMGLEDHEGDMDFKIAGSRKGISALQMDIKLGGISTQILKEAILQAQEALGHILSKMEEAQEKIVLNTQKIPMIQSFYIEPERIVEVIGQGGKTIKEIIEKFEITIDLNRENGEICLNGIGKERLQEAQEYILQLLQKGKPKIDFSSYKPGTSFKGKIKKIVDFGAFIELPNGGDGLLHISKMRHLKLVEGEEIECNILSVEKNKVELGVF